MPQEEHSPYITALNEQIHYSHDTTNQHCIFHKAVSLHSLGPETQCPLVPLINAYASQLQYLTRTSQRA